MRTLVGRWSMGARVLLMSTMLVAVMAMIGAAPRQARGEAAQEPVMPQLADQEPSYEAAFRTLDLNEDGSITLEEWQRFDTTPAAAKNFSALDAIPDGRITLQEFRKHPPQSAEHYQFFEEPSDLKGKKPGKADRFAVNQGLPEDWWLFALHF